MQVGFGRGRPTLFGGHERSAAESSSIPKDFCRSLQRLPMLWEPQRRLGAGLDNWVSEGPMWIGGWELKQVCVRGLAGDVETGCELQLGGRTLSSPKQREKSKVRP